MASEASVQRDVWVSTAQRERAPSTLFRTNSGKAWLSGGGKVRVLADGTAAVPFGRPVALGLAMIDGFTVPGLSDLTGWTDVLITPEMVGRMIPVFTVFETKESGGGNKLAHQINFVQRVRMAGGIAGFAKSAAQAHAIIDAWLRGDPLDLL